MLKKIKKLFTTIKIGPKFGVKNFLFNRNTLRIGENVKLVVDPSVTINDSNIYLHNNSELILGKGVVLKNVNISLKGNLHIGKGSILNNGYLLRNVRFVIDGNLIIGERNRIQCDFLIRYGGNVNIGNSNNINPESEIRCDERISIENYNQISYKVFIWDTNTHNIYSAKKRRELTDIHYPVFGYEYEKPQTKPVKIGNDCWVSRDVSILKGTQLKDKCIVGLKTILSNKVIEESSTVVSNNELKIFNNNL